MIQIMRGDYFILDTLVVELDGMVYVIASEYEKVFYGELVLFWPTDLKTLLFRGRLGGF